MVSLLFNYHNPQGQTDPDAPKIGPIRLRRRLPLCFEVETEGIAEMDACRMGRCGGRVYVDSAPILERAWAERSGLGWIGKHSLLLNKNMGSYFLFGRDDAWTWTWSPTRLSPTIVERAPDASTHVPPTPSFSPMWWTEASASVTSPLSCVGPFQSRSKAKWRIGCLVVTSAKRCAPWNRHASPTTEPRFSPHPRLLDMTQSDWLGPHRRGVQRSVKDVKLPRGVCLNEKGQCGWGLSNGHAPAT